jgi:hypothetical protein
MTNDGFGRMVEGNCKPRVYSGSPRSYQDMASARSNFTFFNLLSRAQPDDSLVGHPVKSMDLLLLGLGHIGC